MKRAQYLKLLSEKKTFNPAIFKLFSSRKPFPAFFENRVNIIEQKRCFSINKECLEVIGAEMLINEFGDEVEADECDGRDTKYSGMMMNAVAKILPQNITKKSEMCLGRSKKVRNKC